MADVRVLVNDIILYRNILADGSARKDDTVLYDSAFLHYAATANDGILHCSFNQAAIGDNGIFTDAVSKYWVGQESLVLV